jgi:hypothetical protein
MSHSIDPIEQLKDVPPSEFVSARNRLAAELKKTDGKRAASIRALPRPSPSVWALNQVARKDRKLIAAFLEASDALERAQAGRGRSEDSRRGYQTALGEQREAMDRVVAAAREALTDAGQSASRAVLERVTDDLRWAVLGAETRDLLEQGELDRDLEPPDFSALVDRIPLTGHTPRARAPERHEREQPATAAAPAAERRAAEKRLTQARERLTEAQDEVSAARAGLRKTKAAHDEAEKALQALRRELATAERNAAAAERAHREAESALDAKLAEQEQAAAEVTASEKESRRHK